MANQYAGPVRPGTDEKAYRETGKSVPEKQFAGPVRPGTDEKTFRRTGGRTSRSSSSSSSSQKPKLQVEQTVPNQGTVSVQTPKTNVVKIDSAGKPLPGQIPTKVVWDSRPDAMFDKKQPKQLNERSFLGSGGSVKSLNEQEKKSFERSKSKNPVTQFTNAFTEGSFIGERNADRLKAEPGAYALGRTARGVVEIAGTAVGARGAGSAVGLAQKTKVGASVVNKAGGIAKIGAVGFGGQQVGERVVRQGTQTKEERELTKSKLGKDVISKAFASEQSAINQGAGFNIPFTNKALNFRGIAFALNPYLSSKKNVFESEIRAELQSKGYKGKELESAVVALKKERHARETGELTGFLATSGASELIGKGLVTSAFKKQALKGASVQTSKSFFKLAGVTAPQIAIAGYGEGFTQDIIQQKSRGQKVNLKQANVMGIYGAVSAGLVGGAIGGFTVKSPGKSKILQGASYIADPFEKPGDLLADVAGSARKGVARARAPKVTPDFDLNFFGVKSPNRKLASRASKRFGDLTPDMPRLVRSFAPVDIISFAPTNTPSSSKSPVNPFTGIPISPNMQDNQVKRGKGQSFNPVPNPRGPTNIPSQNIINNFINPFAETPTETNTNINTNTNTNINVKMPTPTPIWRIPPPMPLNLNFGGGRGFGGGGRKGKKYINELDLGLKLLRGNLL